jgi:hypothetical protein
MDIETMRAIAMGAFVVAFVFYSMVTGSNKH